MTGKNFKPGTTATFTLHSEPVVLGTAVVAANGTVSLAAKLPASVPAGVHTLVISGTGANGEAIEASIKVTVAAAPGSTTAATKPATNAPASTTAGDNGAGDLANTGAGTTPFLLGGLVLLLAGALAVFSRRRRNSTHA